MNSKTFLLATAALCLAWPAVSSADQRPDQGPGAPDSPQRKAAPSAEQRQATPKGDARAPSGPQGPGQGQRQDRGQPQPARPAQTSPPVTQGRTGGQRFQSSPASAPPAQVRQTPRPQPAQNAPPQVRPGRTSRPPANVARLGAWDRSTSGPARQQAGQQWRQGHQGWDKASPWRGNSNWWRGSSAFRLFAGVRAGYLFIPERGYIRAPDGYEQRYWIAGQALPGWMWSYTVSDYWNYGLPEPPDGCAWVWVDNDIALIDTSDGYILDIVHNAW